jgi:16S rRNA (uracil1498-N3)-methyltransferase
MNLILLFESDFIDADHVVLTGRRLVHMTQVHKAKPGAAFRVGIVNGLIGTGMVVDMDSTSIRMEVVCTERPPKQLPCTLLIALPRPKVLRRLVECVAVMGVKKIYIMETWRVEKGFWASPVLDETVLRQWCVLGLEQACDTVMPEILLKRRFRPFVEDEVPAIIRNTRALVANPSAEKPCPVNVSDPVTLAIGPEGGYIPFEIDLFVNTGFEDVTMGARIFRVEHAVPILLGRLFSPA